MDEPCAKRRALSPATRDGVCQLVTMQQRCAVSGERDRRIAAQHRRPITKNIEVPGMDGRYTLGMEVADADFLFFIEGMCLSGNCKDEKGQADEFDNKALVHKS